MFIFVKVSGDMDIWEWLLCQYMIGIFYVQGIMNMKT